MPELSSQFLGAPWGELGLGRERLAERSTRARNQGFDTVAQGATALLFHGMMGIYGFHQTVTDRANIQLMRSQRADRGVFPVLNLAVIYRF